MEYTISNIKDIIRDTKTFQYIYDLEAFISRLLKMAVEMPSPERLHVTRLIICVYANLESLGFKPHNHHLKLMRGCLRQKYPNDILFESMPDDLFVGIPNGIDVSRVLDDTSDYDAIVSDHEFLEEVFGKDTKRHKPEVLTAEGARKLMPKPFYVEDYYIENIQPYIERLAKTGKDGFISEPLELEESQFEALCEYLRVLGFEVSYDTMKSGQRYLTIEW